MRRCGRLFTSPGLISRTPAYATMVSSIREPGHYLCRTSRVSGKKGSPAWAACHQRVGRRARVPGGRWDRGEIRSALMSRPSCTLCMVHGDIGEGRTGKRGRLDTFFEDLGRRQVRFCCVNHTPFKV